MTATIDRAHDDSPLVHQFVRLHGRRPTSTELRDYRRSGLVTQAQARHRYGLRRWAARIIARL